MNLILPMLLGLGIDLIGQNEQRKSQNNYNNFMAHEAEKEKGEVREISALERRMISEGASRMSQKAATSSESMIGAQKVAAAASGMGGGSVTAQNIINDEADKATRDDMFIRFQADTAKWQNMLKERQALRGLDRQIMGYLMGNQAVNAAATWETAGTLLTGATQVAREWDIYKNRN